MNREPGSYTGSSTQAVLSQTNSGAEQFVIEVALDVGGSARIYLFMSEKAYRYTIDKLRRLGFNGDYANPEFAHANGVDLTMRVENYEGKEREKWDFASALPQPAPMDVVRQFNARWKNENRPATKPTAAPASAPPASAPPARPQSAPAKASPVKSTKDKDYAWAQIGLTGVKPSAEKFYESIEAVEKKSGRLEADFNDSDWEQVVESYIPF